MVVCLCTGSSDRDVHRAVEAGARNLSEIGDFCRAGVDCGGCHLTLLGILRRGSCESCPNRNSVEVIPSLEQCAGG